jgi:hypothetical protein
MASASHKIDSIGSLAQTISNLSRQVSEYLTASSHPTPTFDASSAATPEAEEYEALRAPLNDTSLDLLSLVNSPTLVVSCRTSDWLRQKATITQPDRLSFVQPCVCVRDAELWRRMRKLEHQVKRRFIEGDGESCNEITT